MASLATIATIATIGSAVVGVGAAIYQGNETKKLANQQARLEERAGKNEYAASQRIAEQRRMEGELIMSRQQAAAAASGAGSADDAPTITKILANTEARMQYGIDSELYAGEERKYDYFASAKTRRQTGQYNFVGGLLRGLGRGLEGVGDYAALET